METGNRITIQLIENFLVNSLQEKQDLRSKLINFLNATGRIRANDIKVVDENNLIIYESPKSNYKAGRYAPDWYSNLVTPISMKLDSIFKFNYFYYSRIF